MDLVPLKKHSLTRAQFEQLADIPLEEEWLANITNLKTRRAYKEDVREFIAFTALQDYMSSKCAHPALIAAKERPVGNFASPFSREASTALRLGSIPFVGQRREVVGIGIHV